MDPLEELTQAIDQFPTLPDVAMRVGQELDNEDCNMNKVAELVSLDPVLSARILKIANSPLFGASRPADSVKQAVMRLGVRETRGAVMAVSVMNTVPTLPSPLSLDDFWALGLGTGMSARQLAKDLGGCEQEEAYLAGLVHALGEAYLALQYTDRYRAAHKAAHEKETSLEEAIVAEFGVGHPAICARILQKWGLPESICVAVEHQHDPDQAPGDQRLAAILLTADRICRDLGVGPEEASQKEEPWIAQVPEALNESIIALGYPDFSYYLMEQREFLQHVGETVRATFSSSA